MDAGRRSLITEEAPLLPQQIVRVDQEQAALTARHLAGIEPAMMAYFLARREETDAVLAPRFPFAGGKPYPYGRCEEITRDLYKNLMARLHHPVDPVEEAIRDFAVQGGAVRTVWGVLRNQYFQNALQFGGLYVDVSNDTVVTTKPKVEILPLETSGLVSIRDLAHFRETAEVYWDATLYANHLTPSLAPVLPMISVSPGRLQPGFQSACDYMIGLMCRDGFQQAENWLCDGPPPPPDLSAAMRAAIPADLLPRTDNGKAEAVAACQHARAAGCQADASWRKARVMDYLRMMQQP